MRLRALISATAITIALGSPAAGGASGSSGRAALRPTVTVRLGEYFFKLRLVTVHVGQRLRFVNVGKIEHTVADTDGKGNIRSRLIKPRPLGRGRAQVVRFTKPGRVSYLCTFHPTLMKGRILVVP